MLSFNRALVILVIFAVTLELVRSEPVNPPRGKDANCKSGAACNKPPGKTPPGPGQNNAPGPVPGPSGTNPPKNSSAAPIPNAWAKGLDMDPAKWKADFDQHKKPVDVSNEIVPETAIGPLERDFQRFVLAQSWRRSACAKYNKNSRLTVTDCKTYNITGTSDDWSLHGLWPSGQIGDLPPESCKSTVQFTGQLPSKLRNRMDNDFRNVFDGYNDNEAFWQKQWSKHGTCAAQLPKLKSPADYFEKTLDLYDTYKVKTMLNKRNILPTPVVPRSVEDLHEELSKQLGNHKVKITCEDVPDAVGKRSTLIHEVHICLSKSFHLEDCPDPYHYSCGMGQIKYY